MLLTDTCPSWLYEVKAGATTMWERWDALRKMAAAIWGRTTEAVEWYPSTIMQMVQWGISFTDVFWGLKPQREGYKTFRIAPQPGGGLSWAKGNVNTPYGRIRVSWTIENDRFKLEIEVPAGTRCEIILPSGRKVTEGSGSYSYEELLG